MQSTQTPLSGLGVISSLVAPALLILAVASLVGSTLSRIARIGDRARKTIAALDNFRSTHNEEGIRFCRGLLTLYRQRSRLAELALSAYYLSIGLLVAGSLAIALDHFLRGPLPWLASAITMAGALVLLLGTLCCFLRLAWPPARCVTKSISPKRSGSEKTLPHRTYVTAALIHPPLVDLLHTPT